MSDPYSDPRLMLRSEHEAEVERLRERVRYLESVIMQDGGAADWHARAIEAEQREQALLAEVERLRAELARLRALDQYGPNLASAPSDGSIAWSDLAADNLRLRRRVGRLTKAVTWMRGAMEDCDEKHVARIHAWEIARATAVLDES